MQLKQILKNKVLFYLASRYVTYGVQFIISMVIAVKLGPFYLGIWGFLLLLLNYFQQFHFGIYNSLNVLYVQHKDSPTETNNYITNSFVLECYLGILVIFVFVLYKLFGFQPIEKYNADKYFIWVCIIAIQQYFTNLFINVFRVKNKLNHVTFSQSIVVFLNFACIFFFNGEALIYSLLAGNLVGNLLIMLLMIHSGIIGFRSASIRLSYQKEILKKGFLLFLYNSCFYFIIISTRSIISGNYSIEEFGLFTFSFSLAHAVMLLLDSLGFIVFPKFLSRLSLDNKEGASNIIATYRAVYVTAAHGLIYMALIVFPAFIYFFPKYTGALTSMNLIALTILTNTSGCGYAELLIGNNREKELSLFASCALVLNCAVAFFLAKVVEVEFSYVILASLITYMCYSLTITIYGRRLLGEKGNLLSKFFPARLLLPYLTALVLSCCCYYQFLFVPLVLFIILNRKQCLNVWGFAKQILRKPTIVDL